mgnify:CR=1 FL=1|jgi:hypothetical protein
MAGGTWDAQNKARPGIYFRFRSAGAAPVSQGSRGTAAIAKALSWGPVGEVVSLAAGEDPAPAVGYALTEPKALFLRELFKGTNVTGGPTKVLLYRLPAEGAAPASASLAGEDGETALTVTARYPGVRGNDIAVRIDAGVDEPEVFTVTTLVDGRAVDVQQAGAADALADNGWVRFSGPGQLAASAGVSLAGGADGTASNAAYAEAITALEPYSFDILAYDGTDSTVRQAMAAFVKRLAEQEGRHSQLVASGAAGMDSRFVIDVNGGVVLEDGTELAPNETVWWLAGAQAGAQYYQSLTCAAYPGAADVAERKSNSQIEEGIRAGSIVLSREFGQVRVETDINTLTTFTPELGKVFRKNTTMRVCSALANDLYREFSLNYLGRVKNNGEGRGLFKGAVLGYLKAMYDKGALRLRPTGDDVAVEPGDEPDSIVIAVALAIGDAVEKVYLTVTVN